jgi:DNA-binding transcriptional MerR regulator
MVRPVPGGAGGTARPDGGRPMNIGAVLALLREEFPEVTVSKIRFLEAEGLVEPGRTPSGYRTFRDADVERLATVLRLQRDHYLPLKVIREQLAAGEAAPAAEAAREPREGPVPSRTAAALRESAAPVPQRRVARGELLEATGADAAVLERWESFGLVTAGEDGCYDPAALAVGRLVAELAAFGLEPRHLRAVKAAAERQADLVEQVVAPLRRHRSPQSRARVEETAQRMADLSVRLHAALVHSAVRSRPV